MELSRSSTSWYSRFSLVEDGWLVEVWCQKARCYKSNSYLELAQLPFCFFQVCIQCMRHTSNSMAHPRYLVWYTKSCYYCKRYMSESEEQVAAIVFRAIAIQYLWVDSKWMSVSQGRCCSRGPADNGCHYLSKATGLRFRIWKWGSVTILIWCCSSFSSFLICYQTLLLACIYFFG